MDMDAARAAIEGRFNTQWMTGSPAALRTVVGWDGQTFTAQPGTQSVRLTIMDGGSGNASIGSPGSNLVRYAGRLHFQIFVPVGEQSPGVPYPNPSKASRDLADLIEPIFTNWRSDDGMLRTYTMEADTRQEQHPLMMLPVHFRMERSAFIG